jgi:putative ABC transport system substrate-binding protein
LGRQSRARAALAAELVAINCDVIVTSGTESSFAAHKATKTIPIVVAFGPDVLRSGFVTELAHPNGNLTGMTNIGDELVGKRLELLKEILPKLSKVAYFWSSTNPDAAGATKVIETFARGMRVDAQSYEIKEPQKFDNVFRSAKKDGAQAMMLGAGGFFGFHQKQVIELATKHQLPTMYGTISYVDAGGLMAYTYDRPYQFRRAAEYVDKILKGTEPSDLPIERPKKFEFVVNLKAAKQIGLTIPQSVLFRADRVIR